MNFDKTATKATLRKLGSTPAKSIAYPSNDADTAKDAGLNTMYADSERAGTSPNQNPIQKSIKHPKSRRFAMAAKCYDCQGGDVSGKIDPGWRWEGRYCY